jgi:uncharacterized membrane protein
MHPDAALSPEADGEERMDRAEAQRRADQVRAFQQELAALEREGVFTPEPELRRRLAAHHEALLARLARQFDVDTTPRTAQLSLGMRVAALLGAVALIAAVVLFFLRFWGSIPVAGQVVLLVAAPLLMLGATAYASTRPGARPLAELFALVALGAFVLELAALQSIFALRESPHGFLAWGALGLALGHGYAFRGPGTAGVALLAWWLVAMLAEATGGTWRDPVRVPELAVVSGLILFGLGMLARLRPPEMSPSYRLVGLMAAFAALLLLATSGSMNGLGLSRRAAETLYQLLTLATSAAVIVVGVRRGWRESIVAGTGAFLLLAVIKSVDWFWDWMPRYLYFLTLGLVALLVVLVLRRWRLAGRSA